MRKKSVEMEEIENSRDRLQAENERLRAALGYVIEFGTTEPLTRSVWRLCKQALAGKEGA
jgi:hypothetical protein